ncbi:DUF1778 domain-containing protein [Pseudoxanthobacter sp. M-2]|uniref:type II toxin-antitoxin system TacA family antitoxin n=1 Tax=Pseudoxanthobacter sp. M-2 TaxID=3078754 RepID=UPI0038FBFAC0
MEQATKQSRLEARITSDTHSLLKRAAEIEGRTVTDFVVAAAREAALQTIERNEVIRLSREASERFAEMLNNPPPVADAMRRTRERHERLVGPL